MSGRNDADTAGPGGSGHTIPQLLRLRQSALTAQEQRAASYLAQHYPASGLGPMAG